MSDHIAGYGLEVGSFVAPIWGGAGGGSAMGNKDDRQRFVSQVKKASAIGEQMRDIGIRPTGGIRIDSSVGVQEWDKDPVGNTKLIAETFREAAKVAQDHGEFLVCRRRDLLGRHAFVAGEREPAGEVDMPDVVGYQADMAHSMLFVLGDNAEKDRLLPEDYDWKDRAELDKAYKKVADALRPWTYDFHVAQNDGTMFGSGDHEKTGRHCQVDRSQRQARYRQACRLLAARRQGQPDQEDAAHLLGRMHVPQRGDGEPADLERRSRRDAEGARSARLAGIGDRRQSANDHGKRRPQHRDDRLRLHGPGPFQRLSARSATSSIWSTSRC